MITLNPYLRYIACTSYLPNKDFVKAYDCRFFFVLSGEGELITEKESFILRENTLAYYPSGLAYFLKTSAENPLSFISVNFDFTQSYPVQEKTLRPVRPEDYVSALERTTQNEISEKRFCGAFTLDCADFLRDDLVTLSLLFKKEGPYTKDICYTLLKYIILKILNNFPKDKQENKAVRRIVDYIECHYSEKLDNNTLAMRFGYHPYYISSLFKIHVGKPLHQYVLESRLNFGADMLLHTGLPISEIAEKCGFQNANHFSVKFKAKYGQPPSIWRTLNGII